MHSRPCSVMINPGRGTSPSPDDDRHSRADYPGQKIVGKRPQPVKDVKPVKCKLNGCVFAGECAVPLPTALRYGKGLETRPIFTRTVCHSRTSNRPHLSMTRVVWSSPAHQNPVWCNNSRGNRTESLESLRGGLLHHFDKGAAILGCTQNAPLQPRGCDDTSSPTFLSPKYKHQGLMEALTYKNQQIVLFSSG